MGLSAHARKKEKDYEQEGSAARGEKVSKSPGTNLFLTIFPLLGIAALHSRDDIPRVH